MRKRIYISGPITRGHSYFGRNYNLFQANAAQSELMQAEYATYNPMLSMHQQEEIDWSTWLECDESWIAVSDLVLRLPGASLGAERECEFARTLKIPVVGVAYFFPACPCLQELFPDETEPTYSRLDLLNLMRYHRQCRRENGLPTISEREASQLHPIIAEGFSRAKI